MRHSSSDKLGSSLHQPHTNRCLILQELHWAWQADFSKFNARYRRSRLNSGFRLTDSGRKKLLCGSMTGTCTAFHLPKLVSVMVRLGRTCATSCEDEERTHKWSITDIL